MKLFYLLLAPLIAMSLPASGSSYSHQRDRQEYENDGRIEAIVGTCPPPSRSTHLRGRTAKEFSDKLEVTMRKVDDIKSSAQDKYRKLEDYSRTKFGRRAIDGLSSCYKQQINPIKDDVRRNFYMMKDITRNSEERDALINAYSSWETLVDSMVPNSREEHEYRKAISQYRHMWGPGRRY